MATATVNETACIVEANQSICRVSNNSMRFNPTEWSCTVQEGSTGEFSSSYLATNNEKSGTEHQTEKWGDSSASSEAGCDSQAKVATVTDDAFISHSFTTKDTRQHSIARLNHMIHLHTRHGSTFRSMDNPPETESEIITGITNNSADFLTESADGGSGNSSNSVEAPLTRDDILAIAILNAREEELDLEEMDLLIQLGLLNIQDLISHEPDMRVMEECQVCFEVIRLQLRPCCRKPICDSCLEHYVETQINDYGILRVSCPNPSCNHGIYHDEIRLLLREKPALRDRYDHWIVDLNADFSRKTCPQCCHITELDPTVLKGQKAAKHGLKIQCVECQMNWCFLCQAPWHNKMTCRKYRAGDLLVKHWAHEQQRGQYNAQRCPTCKVRLYGTYFNQHTLR